MMENTFLPSSAFKLESECSSQSPTFIGGENASDSRTSAIIESLRPLVEPLGYEILHLEVHNSREKVLRLYIDFSVEPVGSHPKENGSAIGIEDCVKVTRALNEVLGDEEATEIPAPPRSEIAIKIDSLFSGPYELEVSSPGVDRPLRHSGDFTRFDGQEARVHTFRPLTGEEAMNADYISKNPKQKNFLGTLRGVSENAVIMDLSAQDGIKKKVSKTAQKKASQAGLRTDVEQSDERKRSRSDENARRIRIPLSVISKANLEPDFTFPHSQGDES